MGCRQEAVAREREDAARVAGMPKGDHGIHHAQAGPENRDVRGKAGILGEGACPWRAQKGRVRGAHLVAGGENETVSRDFGLIRKRCVHIVGMLRYGDAFALNEGEAVILEARFNERRDQV